MSDNLSSRCPALLVILMVLCMAGAASSFQVPETLKYDLSWTGIKAGESVIEIKMSGDNVLISSVTKSAKWLSVFYTVDDRVESRLTAGTGKNILGPPISYKLNLREGRHRKNKEVIFENRGAKARYIDHITDEKKEFDLPPDVFDPLSCFFQLRGMTLEAGRSVYIRIFDSKKIYDAEVQVLRKERITGPSGEVDTFVIRPIMKSEGIFYRKGEMLIWVTADEKKVPVRMKAQVKIGSVTADLTGGNY
ncbi:MAG: DUF3108 domain-containing protein [Nitrospirae bacterium]|nr:DUF3108 domain-containing protein [Nitrospirota bacterium]